MTIHTLLWLGSQASFEASQEAHLKALADPKFSAASDYSSEIVSHVSSVQDGVATISVSGSLVSGSAGYAIYYGNTGYEDIRAALASAVSNPQVSAILLNVDSVGGAVSGVHELAQLIARVSAVKPVVTYTGGNMLSAALWAGISGSYTVASETAIVGSIGILMVHMERSKQLEEMGIKATVIRAGSEKALASPYEALTEKAEANLQAQADTFYEIFLEHVSKSVGLPYATADEKFGQGRTFVGKDALKVGLVNKIGNYEDAFMKAVSLGAANVKKRVQSGARAEVSQGVLTTSQEVQGVAASQQGTSEHNQQNHLEGTQMSTPLTPEQLAAMAAGVTLDSTQPEAAGDKSQGGEDDALDSSVNAEEVAANAAALASAQAEVTALTAKVSELEGTLNTLKPQAEAALAIAKASVITMGVHFGVKVDQVNAMAPAEILAKHAELAEAFRQKFKVGGVAATTPEKVTEAKATVLPHFFQAALMSTAK